MNAHIPDSEYKHTDLSLTRQKEPTPKEDLGVLSTDESGAVSYESMRKQLIAKESGKGKVFLQIVLLALTWWMAYKQQWVTALALLLVWLGRGWKSRYVKQLPENPSEYNIYHELNNWMRIASLYTSIAGVVVITAALLFKLFSQGVPT